MLRVDCNRNQSCVLNICLAHKTFCSYVLCETTQNPLQKSPNPRVGRFSALRVRGRVRLCPFSLRRGAAGRRARGLGSGSAAAPVTGGAGACLGEPHSGVCGGAAAVWEFESGDCFWSGVGVEKAVRAEGAQPRGCGRAEGAGALPRRGRAASADGVYLRRKGIGVLSMGARR